MAPTNNHKRTSSQRHENTTHQPTSTRIPRWSFLLECLIRPATSPTSDDMIDKLCQAETQNVMNDEKSDDDTEDSSSGSGAACFQGAQTEASSAQNEHANLNDPDHENEEAPNTKRRKTGSEEQLDEHASVDFESNELDIDALEQELANSETQDVQGPSSHLPISFPVLRHKNSQHYFACIVEWMVHNMLNPGFDRNAAMFQNSFDYLDRVAAYIMQARIEPEWKTEFIKTLQARPCMLIQPYPESEERRPCGACDNFYHTADYYVVFDEPPYSSTTLESLDEGNNPGFGNDNNNDEKESGSENSEGHYRDRDGNPIAPPGKHFYLARFCAESAGLIHMFTHWRHQLDRQVTDYLWRNDVFSEARIVRRLAWTDSQRRIFSNKIANRMLRCGKIVRLSSAMREEWKVPFYESQVICSSRRHNRLMSNLFNIETNAAVEY